MTKYKAYKCGKHSFKSYFKAAGKGYEVGFTHGGRNYFVSNFVHKAEATKWWTMFNKEIASFGRKHWVNHEIPFVWYCNFLSKHLYSVYYAWLDKVLGQHSHNFKKAYNKDFKQYMSWRKTADHTRRYSVTHRAA